MQSAMSKTAILAATICCSAFTLGQGPLTAAAPKAEEGYSLRVFARGVTGKYTNPDSVAVSGSHVFVGFGDGSAPDGSDGKKTQIVEYGLNGNVEFIYSVLGHNDGLKVNPYTHALWALQNEDANPRLVVIDPETHERTLYSFQAVPAAGGGYDDIVFRQGKVYLSSSNPANNPNLGPAIVEAKLESGHTIAVTPVFYGNAQATNVVTGAKVTLNLQDPDSMTLDPTGDLFLTSQADAELVVVRRPGTKNQSALLIPLTSPYGAPMVDDTVFTPANDGYILVADKGTNTIYALRKNAFAPGAAYSAAQAGSGSDVRGFVGRLDVEFGLLTPVVTGLSNPGGLAFVKTNQGDSEREDLLDLCNAIGSGK